MAAVGQLSVLAVPAFDDNYLWLIHDSINAVAVDPGDATPVLAALQSHNLSLAAILLTHHHADHVGGVSKLLKHFNIPVFGPRDEAISGITRQLAEGDSVHIAALDLSLSVLDVPGHTLGHIAYVAPKQGWVFSGDTLFAGGCGRLFEGSPAQMAASLAKLAALPDETEVYCAHEYTLANLRFALEVEPENNALITRIAAEQKKRASGIPTVPSTIGLEKRTNPFLRYRQPAIIDRLISTGHLICVPDDPIDVFAALRKWKNTYR